MKIEKIIGNTPIVKIKVKYKNKIKNIYAKLEYYNYTGSIKDRLANYIINKSYENNTLKKNMPIIEATSGNTGISFAAIGTLYKHPVHIFMPDWASEERVKLMKLYGAKVYLISKENGGFAEAIRQADNLAKEINGFRPNQFINKLNVEAHYNGTGTEIANALDKIDTFVSGYGTGGTIIGIGKRLKEKFKNLKVIALEPENMTLLSENKRVGSHRIEGIGDEFLPELIDKEVIDSVITINDAEAINMSKKLARELGLGIGISSGANFLASVLSPGTNVVTVFADDNKKYLTTDLTKEENKRFISDSIKLIDIEVI